MRGCWKAGGSGVGAACCRQHAWFGVVRLRRTQQVGLGCAAGLVVESAGWVAKGFASLGQVGRMVQMANQLANRRRSGSMTVTDSQRDNAPLTLR
jgi:hypothetical protein